MTTEHNTEIQVGDVFVYRGLTGQGAVQLQRLIVIDRMAVLSGHVYFDVIVDGFAPTESQINISDAMEMIRQGIWDYVGKKDEISMPATVVPSITLGDEGGEFAMSPDTDGHVVVQHGEENPPWMAP